MKQTIQSMRAFIVYSIVLSTFFACNTGSKESAGAGDRIPDSKHRILLSEKKVLHFDNWRALYLSQDSIRETFHVGHYMAARGLSDTNQVYVIDLISDSSKIDDYLTLPFLGAMRNRSGVFDSVITHQIQLLRDDTTVAATNDRLVLVCQVADVQKAVSALDAQGLSKRAALGLVDRGIGVGEDQKTLYLFYAIPDLAKANTFAESKEYAQWLEKLGVAGSPRVLRYKIEL